jgi:hypothetical protein
MRFPRKRGSTSVMVRVFIPDNTATNGAGLTGLTNASTNLAIAFGRELQNGFTQITGADLVTITTIGTWANPGTGKLGFKAVDGTNAPGLYEIHFPNDAAAFGTGDASQAVYLNILELTTTALKIGPNMVLIPLVPWDYQDGAAMGLSNLDAAITSRMATFTQPTGFLAATFPPSVASPTNITAGTITTTTNLTNLPSIPNNWITATGITDGALTGAKFASGAFDAVWSVTARTLTSFGTLATDVWAVATRTLTAGTNIALAKGTGVTGFNDPASAQIASDVWDEILTGATHNIATSAGRRLRQIQAGAEAFSGTLTGSPTTTVVRLDASASTTTDFYLPGLVVVESSFGVQFRRIAGYDGSTKDVTVATPFVTVPASGDGVTIVPWASVRVSDMDTDVLDASAIKADAVTKMQAGLATPADVNAQVLDVLTVDTFAEPSAVPAATSTLKDKLVWLFTLGRNTVTQTATTQTVRDDADATDVATASVSDDGTTFTRDQWQ